MNTVKVQDLQGPSLDAAFSKVCDSAVIAVEVTVQKAVENSKNLSGTPQPERVVYIATGGSARARGATPDEAAKRCAIKAICGDTINIEG